MCKVTHLRRNKTASKMGPPLPLRYPPPRSQRRFEERLDADDHHFGGLHEGCGGLTFAELHFAGCVGGDDGGDLLVSYGQNDLCEQSAEFHFDDFAYQLIASADVAEAFTGFDAGLD